MKVIPEENYSPVEVVKELVVEKHSRTLLKALSWRLVGTLTTFGITFSLTNSLNVATIVGVAEFVSKILLFYAHERVWIKINKFFLK